MQPTIQPFFDPATWTVTYAIYQQGRSECTIIDSVLDYDPKSGRTSTASADKVIAFIREHGLRVEHKAGIVEVVKIVTWRERRIIMAHRKPFLTIAFLTTLAFAGAVKAADVQRQAEVARLGADVMPFTLKGTTHIFTKTKDGGIQRVIVNVPSDTEQVSLVREHLRTIQRQFSQGDFSGPTHIHGPAMPGLSELKAAKPGQIEIEYKEVPAGAELTYRSEDKTLVAALHNWFDAQLSDHGADAMVGDQRHPNHGALMKQ